MITLSDTGLLGAPLPVSRQDTAHGNGLALARIPAGIDASAARTLSRTGLTPRAVTRPTASALLALPAHFWDAPTSPPRSKTLGLIRTKLSLT